MPLTARSISSISLDSAGLVALADLKTVSERTALLGTSWYTDVLFLAPGLHTQQDASNVNGGELPAAGAMNSGYVFRIENQAMVFWLQRVGRPGHLVNAMVESISPDEALSGIPTLSYLLYMTGIALTVACFFILGFIHDYWAMGVLAMLVVARALNVVIFRRRAVPGWKGKKEPGQQADLLVILSQDRWVRLGGTVDNVKLVTSGQWVRELKMVEGFFVAFATLLVYGAAALAPNASTIGSLIIATLLLVSIALLGLCNALTKDLRMFNCKVHVSGPAKGYERRLHMAEELIEEHDGRRDWAVGMGLVQPQPDINV